MFYILSKVFWFFAQPLNLAIFLLVAGLLAAAARRRHLAWTGICLSGRQVATSGSSRCGDQRSFGTSNPSRSTCSRSCGTRLSLSV